MILSTIQPSFLPWLGYFEQMIRADIFVYLDDVKYTKQDWRNRNRFNAGSGKIEYLTVPIRAEDASAPINRVRIAEGAWASKIVNRLEEWYRKAPAFKEFFPQICDELLKEGPLLGDLDVRLTALMAKFMGIETPIAFSSDIPGKSADRSQKLIDICLHHGADVLYDGAAAASFIDVDLFRANGIEVVFQAYRPVVYPQGGGSFISHLSALDTLFNCGERTRQVMLDGGVSRETALGRSLPHSICPVCGSRNWAPFMRGTTDRSLLTDQTIAGRRLEKVICSSCALISNSTFGGDDTLASYEHGYQLNTGHGEEHIYFTPAGPLPRSAAYLNWIGRMLDIEPESVAEIGCGKGSLLARLVARYEGLPVTGFEANRCAAKIARERGLDVVQGFVGEIEIPPADLVVCVGVLEHVEDATGFLEHVLKACKPGGRAVFVVPLQDSGGYDFFFADHVWHFLSQHFRKLLARCGWQVLTLDPADPVIHGMGMALCTPRPAMLTPQAEEEDLAAAQERNRDVWLRRFEEVNQRLAAFHGQPLIVFGSGEVFSLLRAYTDLARANILGCLDEDASKVGSMVHGIEVYGLDWLDSAPAAPIFVTVNPRYNHPIQQKLERFGRPLVFWGDSW